MAGNCRQGLITEQEIFKQEILTQLELDQQKASKGWMTRLSEPLALDYDTQRLKEVQEAIDRALPPKDKAKFEALERECMTDLLQAVAAQDATLQKRANKKSWKLRCGDASRDFCERVLRYENVFDVLNNQAPQYTSILWAAVKFLLLYHVNDKHLKDGVLKYLEDIGLWLDHLKAVASLKPVKQITEAVTRTYKSVMKFVGVALEYYGEGRLARIFNNVKSPWEVRFQPLVAAIKDDIQHVQNVANLCQLYTTQRVHEGNVFIATQLMETRSAVTTVGHDLIEKAGVLIKNGTEVKQEMEKLGSWVKSVAKHFPVLDVWSPAVRKLLIEDQATHAHPTQASPLEMEHVSDILDPEENDDCLLAWTNISLQSFPALENVCRSGDVKRNQYDLLSQRIDPLWQKRSNSLVNLQWNLISKGEIFQWLKAKKSNLLWIEGYKEIGLMDWTSVLTLEISSLATRAPGATVLVFYCGETDWSAVTAASGPSVLLQTFIYQLVYQHPERFAESNPCHRHALSIERLRASEVNFIQLWSIFAACLEISRTQFIHLFIDNIEGLSGSTSTVNDLSDLDLLFEFLDGLSKSTSPICKILITCRKNHDRNLDKPGEGVREHRDRFNKRGNHHFLEVTNLQESRATYIEPVGLMRLQERKSSISMADFGAWMDKKDGLDIASPLEPRQPLFVASSVQKSHDGFDEEDDLFLSDWSDSDSILDGASTARMTEAASLYATADSYVTGGAMRRCGRHDDRCAPDFDDEEALDRFLAESSSEEEIDSLFGDDEVENTSRSGMSSQQDDEQWKLGGKKPAPVMEKVISRTSSLSSSILGVGTEQAMTVSEDLEAVETGEDDMAWLDSD